MAVENYLTVVFMIFHLEDQNTELCHEIIQNANFAWNEQGLDSGYVLFNLAFFD